MIDATCNYLNPYVSATLHAATIPTQTMTNAMNTTPGSEYATSTNSASLASFYSKSIASMPSTSCNPNAAAAAAATAALASSAAMKLEMQYPPQASSTGSASPNSSIQSAPSSASVSPNIFPSPAQSFASISSSPPASATSVSPLTGSPANAGGGITATGHPDLGAAAAASAAYSWNTYSAALPPRTQFPYAQYATDYYGNVGMSASAAAGAAWFSHQDSLYQPWTRQTYPSFNFDDIAFQTQLQRRSVRCTCPNCTNEMSGLPPIVGPDERGRKQHICHIPGCERLYGKASHLKTHLRWHTGERPFLCLTCGKRFSRSDELQRHGRTHTNYRPYACPICSKKFSRSDHLSKHKKTHFKDKKSKKALAAEAKEQAANASNNNTSNNLTANIKQEAKTPNETQEKITNSNNNNNNSVRNNNNNTNLKSGQINSSSAASSNLLNSSHSSIPSSSATTTVKTSSSRLQQSSVSTLQLKTEQPDIPSGYNPYSNLYHQSSSLFHPHAHHLSSSASASAAAAYSGLHHQSSSASSAIQQSAASSSLDLWHSQQQSRHSLVTQQSASNNSSSTSQNSLLHSHHLQQNTAATSPHSNASSNNPHYASLAMQSESQLAAEYSLSLASNGVGCGSTSPVNHSLGGMQHSSASSYSNLIGQMKSEYPGYPDFPTSSGYPSTTSAFHHHPHNPWAAAAAYQHQHATA